LPLLGQQRDRAAHVMDEAHIEHAVRFVEDEDFDAREVNVTLPDQIAEAARRGDEDIDPLLQRSHLR
jgi:hypothetical protein